jgi:hypothetical protein
MQSGITIELWVTAIIVGIAIVAAFTYHFAKQNAAKPGGVYWTAANYFEHLKKNIILADNLETLKALQASVEGFRVKTFRGRIFRRDRKRYYRQLKDAYTSKERDLILHPKVQQLCKS